MSKHFYDLFQPTERINPDSKCEIESLKHCVFVLRTENEKLKEALKPFASLADEIEFCAGPDGNPNNWSKACTWHDLVSARAALAGEPAS